MSELRDLLESTANIAGDFLESLGERPVVPEVDLDALRRALGGPLPDGPTDAQTVVAGLARDADPGIVASPSGRYFGFVIGGAVPAALAADWLTAAWDQNAGLYASRRRLRSWRKWPAHGWPSCSAYRRRSVSASSRAARWRT